MLHDLFEIVPQCWVNWSTSRGPCRPARPLERFIQLIGQFRRECREIIDEIERVLDLVRDACSELAERSQLLGLNQPVLRGAQFIERSGEFFGPLLYLFEHSDIADGDHGLIGKGLEQSDLLVTEGVHLGTAEHDGSDALAFTQQGYAQNGAGAGRAVLCRVSGNWSPSAERMSCTCTGFRSRNACPATHFRLERQTLIINRYRSVMCADAQAVAILQEHDGIDGIAELAGTLDNGLENRFDIGRRGGNHAEDVAAAGLVGQRLGKVAGLAWTSSNRRAF